MDQAPINSSEIYSWLKKHICQELQNTKPDYDSEKMESICEIFSDDIDPFNKVALNLFDATSDKYKEKLFDEIQKITNDSDKKLEAYINFFVNKKLKNLIIVLDNCDKRNLEEQLLVFEGAN